MLHAICFQLLCNTFSIVNAELRSIGAGIYIGYVLSTQLELHFVSASLG